MFLKNKLLLVFIAFLFPSEDVVFVSRKNTTIPIKINNDTHVKYAAPV
jgi:hypothetical protein